MKDAQPRTVVHRSRIDRLPEEPPPNRQLSLAEWLSWVNRADLEVVAERPAYWESLGPWDTGWRSMSWHLVMLVVRGGITLREEGGPLTRLGPGALFWTPPRSRHRVLVEAGRYYFLRFRLRDPAGANLTFGGIRVHRDAQPVEPLFELLCDDLRFDHPHLAARLRALLVLLASADAPVEEGERGTGFSPAVRRRMAQLVHERLDTGLRPAELAEAVGLSPVTFARSFRRIFGCSARRWLADQRLRVAAQHLVSGSDAIADVAKAAGFANPSQFARRFRSLFGTSPAEYRLQRAAGG